MSDMARIATLEAENAAHETAITGLTRALRDKSGECADLRAERDDERRLMTDYDVANRDLQSQLADLREKVRVLVEQRQAAVDNAVRLWGGRFTVSGVDIADLAGSAACEVYDAALRSMTEERTA